MYLHPEDSEAPESLADVRSIAPVRVISRTFTGRIVLDTELVGLTSDGPTLYVAFFSTTFGVCATFAAVLASTTLTPKGFASFLALTIASACLSAFFGACSIAKLRHKRRLVREVYGEDRRIPIARD